MIDFNDDDGWVGMTLKASDGYITPNAMMMMANDGVVYDDGSVGTRRHTFFYMT